MCTPFVRKDLFVMFSLILFAISITLLVYSSYFKVTAFSEENIIGLAGELNKCYWLGLIFNLSSIFLLILNSYCDSNEKIFLAEVCLFAIYLYAIPALVEENVYFPDTWGHSAGSISILIHGNYDQTGSWYVTQYPGVFLFLSMVILTTGVNPIILAKYYPVLFSIYVVLISYILLRKLLPNKRLAYFATIFLVSGSVWVFPKHFCPNSFAFIWYLLIFYLAFSKRGIKTIGLSIFLAMITIVSHPTTLPFLILSVILVPTAFTFLSKKMSDTSLDRYWSLSQTFTIFVIVAWFAWSMFNAIGQLTYLTNTVMRFFKFLSEYMSLEKTAERFQTASYHKIGQTLKLSYSILYIAVSVIGAFYLIFEIFKKKKKENAYLLKITVGWIVACAIFGVATAFLQGGEFYERSLLYGYVPLSVLAAFIYKNKHGKLILISTLLIGAPLSIFATYSNEYFEYSPISNSYGSIFMVSRNITQNVKIGPPTSGVYRFYLYYQIYRCELNVGNQSLTGCTFFVWSQASNNYYSVYVKGRNYTQLSSLMSRMSWMDKYPNMVSQPNFNLIYNNGDFHVVCANESIIVKQTG